MSDMHDESLDAASSALKDAIMAFVRQALSDSGGSTGASDPEEIRGLVKDEIQQALGEIRVPTDETIAAIAKGEMEGLASREDLESGIEKAEENLRESIRSVLEEKMAAFAESEQMLESIEGKLEGLRTELDGVENQEDQIKEKLSFIYEGEAFNNAVTGLVADKIPSEEAIAEVARKLLAEEPPPSVSKEEVQAVVEESLKTWADDLRDELGKMIEAKAGSGGGVDASEVQELVKGALAEEMGGDGFRTAITEAVSAQAAGLKPDLDAWSEPLSALATKTTEKILAREAEGLVRQIKIELGKVRNEMKKNMEQTVAFLRSPEMEKLISDVVAKTSKAPDIEELKGTVQEVATDAVKGMMESVRSSLDDGVDERLAKFVESDVLRESVTAIASEVVPAGGGGGDGGGGGGGGANPAEIRKIVGEEIMKRTEEAFSDMIPRHVGKFLDEKLPPPEYFQSLVTTAQLQQEIDKRVKGASTGSGSSRGISAGPGESAIFTNMIGRVLASDELKELIDDKFRVINTYIKNELVPKAVKKELEK